MKELPVSVIMYDKIHPHQPESECNLPDSYQIMIGPCVCESSDMQWTSQILICLLQIHMN